MSDIREQSQEVSIKTNLMRTVFLVTITVILMGLVRFSPFLSHGMQHIAGTIWWQKLYEIFHIETALGREQMLLIAITIVCFLLALCVQILGILILRKLRNYRALDRG